MRLPTLNGLIKRRLLINFRATPDTIHKLLPAPFRPKLHRGYSIVGICLIRLEEIRPFGMPKFFGVSSENAAHRIAVEWNDDSGVAREGVFIPRRDTGSTLTRLAGGRLFPGEHHSATFDVTEQGNRIDFQMRSKDGQRVTLLGHEVAELPGTSCFASLKEASAYFESGSLGYSSTRDSNRLDGLQLRTEEWRVGALEISKVFSSYFEDRSKFPQGTIEFDHALIMRNINHRWQSVPDLGVVPGI